MPLRLLEYQVAIIKMASEKKKMVNKSYIMPLVIPIVLYTGKRKWNANKYIENCQEKLEGYSLKFGNYNIVDVNDFSQKELLNDNSFISKIMLIEKGNNSDEIVKILNEVKEKTKEEDKELLKRIMFLIFEEKLGYKDAKKLVNKILGGNEEMLTVVDTIRKENQMYITIGRKEGKEKGRIEGEKEGKKQKEIEIVKKMLKEKFNIETIQRITGVKKEEIEKLNKK